ncbi:putative acetyltransferase [Arthrobacter sp. CAN_A212]
MDGIANFKLPWSRTVDDVGTLIVESLEATNPQAYRALWQILLDFDLTRKVIAHSRPRDEPLRQMLSNPRAMRITRQADNLWMRLLDVPSALETRTYAGPEAITFAVETDEMVPRNVGVWRLEADAVGASCVRTDTTPDLAIDIQALGALYLGGMSAHLLAAAGRIRPESPTSVETLSRMFRTDPEPHNSFGF